MRFSVLVGSRLRKFSLLRRLVKYYAEFLSSLLFCDLFHLPSYSKSRLHQICHFGMETFFGYYDSCPLSQDGYLLFHASSLPTSSIPNPHVPVEICCYKFPQKPNDLPVYLASTFAFNWQQGSMLTWIDNDLFVFNNFCFDAKAVVAEIHSLKNGLFCRIPYPVHAILSPTQYLSLNYRRISRLHPEYGYPSLFDFTIDDNNLGDTHLSLFDLTTLKSRNLFSYAQCVDMIKGDSLPLDSQRVFINHTSVSPSSKSFVFILRAFFSKRRSDTLFMFDLDAGRLAPLFVDSTISHYTWKDDRTLVIYMSYNGIFGCYLLSLDDLVPSPIFSKDSDLNGLDGHPCFIPGSDSFITDTYPNIYRSQKLFKIGISDSSVTLLSSLQHSFKFKSACRCDFHPNYSSNPEGVFFDSVHTGKRSLFFQSL